MLASTDRALRLVNEEPDFDNALVNNEQAIQLAWEQGSSLCT